ncbi:MAG: hypothetical protein Q9M41_12010 [Paracoccaceae bacterium]|nr:hypothetical protein [Paracoccaceae bacterium]
MTRKWKARIRVSNGAVQEIYVEADNHANARAMIETQYGAGCILSGPMLV